MPAKKKMSDEAVEEELDKALKENEAKKDHCGVPLSPNLETGVQRDQAKVKKKKDK